MNIEISKELKEDLDVLIENTLNIKEKTYDEAIRVLISAYSVLDMINKKEK